MSVAWSVVDLSGRWRLRFRCGAQLLVARATRHFAGAPRGGHVLSGRRRWQADPWVGRARFAASCRESRGCSCALSASGTEQPLQRQPPLQQPRARHVDGRDGEVRVQHA